MEIFLSVCRYFQLDGHNLSITDPGYIRLPNRISELNDYMCQQMNRKGLLCSECIEGFGPSPTSPGYVCSNCTDNWSGALLYILIALLPVTLSIWLYLYLESVWPQVPWLRIHIVQSNDYEYNILCLTFRCHYPVIPTQRCWRIIVYTLWSMELRFHSLCHTSLLCQWELYSHQCWISRDCFSYLPSTTSSYHLDMCWVAWLWL